MATTLGIQNENGIGKDRALEVMAQVAEHAETSHKRQYDNPLFGLEIRTKYLGPTEYGPNTRVVAETIHRGDKLVIINVDPDLVDLD